MNPQLPTIPSVLNTSSNQMPTIPQFQFDYGQGSWEKQFTPDMGMVSKIISQLKSGEVNFDKAAGSIIGSAGDARVSAGLAPEMVKQALVKSFGGQSFQGADGQTGYFNEKNYGFIPQTTKNVVSRTTGMGATSKTMALPQIPKI